MNKQKLNAFIIDVDNLHKAVNDNDIKNHLCTEFQRIKKKHIAEKEKSKPNVYDEVEKIMYNSRKEKAEVITVNMDEYKATCDNNTRVQRIELVNQKLQHMEGEPLMISYLKGYLLFCHKNAIGIKNFVEFLANTNENYDYSTFLIKLYKLVDKYKGLQCCKLPVRFFKSKFSIIRQICINNSSDWE